MTMQSEMDEVMGDALTDDMSEAVTTESEEPEDAVKDKVAAWAAKVEGGKDHWENDFNRMREDMKFARGLQWPGQENLDDPRYTANLVQRHLRQREAALYAKNPRAVATKRETIDYRVWDGNSRSLMEAQQMLQQAQQLAQQAFQMGDPRAVRQAQQMMQSPQIQRAQELLQDYEQGEQRRQLIDKMGQTLEIVWEHQIKQQKPPFKKSMKRLVRRTLTTGVGYLKLGYVRQGEMPPGHADRVTDTVQQIRYVEGLLEEVESDEQKSEYENELNELNDALRSLENTPPVYREGLDIDYPRSTSIIPDPCCTELDGFLGASWVAQEFKLTPDQVKQIYDVDVGEKFTPYDLEGNKIGKDAFKERDEGAKQSEAICLVWEIYDKVSRSTFTICQGYDNYLREPDAPEVYLDRFWPFFALYFNGLEDEENLFPPSDVFLMKQQQIEHNLTRQRLREHRDAARPGHVTPKGRMENTDRDRLSNREAHDVLELNGLGEQDDIRKILQAIPTNPIDPNLYETSTIEGDLYKVLGSQEAVMGGISGGTATETSIAESSRISAIGSAVDDLDDFLTEIARSASRVLLSEMSRENVMEIAGVGAVWPEFTSEELAENLWLEVRAGSSGRPNKSSEIQNLERVMPFLLQIPGVKPERVIEEILTRLDDRMNIQEFIETGVPSIMAQNRMDQVSTGDAQSDPNQQGSEGGDKNAVGQGDSNLGPRDAPEPRNMDPNRAS